MVNMRDTYILPDTAATPGARAKRFSPRGYPVIRPETLAVIGLGAIGGSVAWQATRAGVRVIGVERVRHDAIEALRRGAVAELADDPAAAARRAQLVILAVPPRRTLALVRDAAGWLPPEAVLSDVASVKVPVLQAAREAGLAGRFAGAHPLAGTHATGFGAAAPDRFRGCIAYVCAGEAPGAEHAASAVAGFWREVLEAHPVLIGAAEHDRQLAWTSHLPQGIASALAHVLGAAGLAGLSYGPGARDTTRLAASDPDLWTEILLMNAGPVAAALDAAAADVATLRRLVAAGDPVALREFLAAAADFRRSLDR